MRLVDLLNKYSTDDITSAIMRLYPDEEENVEGYEKVIEKLLTLTPMGNHMRIYITSVIEDGYTYFHVHGQDGSLWKDDDCWDCANPNSELRGEDEVRWGLDFRPWNEWLASEIVVADMAEIDIAAHLIYDMTFYGYDETTIQGTWAKIGSDVEEITAKIDKERKELH